MSSREPEPEPLPAPAPSPALEDALSRLPAGADVESLGHFVEMVTSFGPGRGDEPRNLAHPHVRDLVQAYMDKFACPKTTPGEFGTTRALMGCYVLGFGHERFREAEELVVSTIAQLNAVKESETRTRQVKTLREASEKLSGEIPDMHGDKRTDLERELGRLQGLEAALEMLTTRTLPTIRRGPRHAWFS